MPPVPASPPDSASAGACGLLTKNEVEGLVGRPALAGAREGAANLETANKAMANALR